MYTLSLQNWSVGVDFEAGTVKSVLLGGRERCVADHPLFRLRLRLRNGGTAIHLSVSDAKSCRADRGGALYSDFSLADCKEDLSSLAVRVSLTDEDGDAAWRISVTNKNDNLAIEWVDFAQVSLPTLCDNNASGTGGKLLLPFNEGVLISDGAKREACGFRYRDPEYPSLGSYFIFPNMISSQILAYLWEDVGLYIGAHDARRGVKGIDFLVHENCVTLQLRLFCGVDFGEDFAPDFPIVWSRTDGRWESSAERYRNWFSSALPQGVKKIKDNATLPAWYADSPLVVSYPIRGIHDMDEMKPNAFFPYVNALQLIREIKDATQSRLLVLLMHWEGTAPWAPPYVWPPYGGEDALNAFRDALHDAGDLLGVYCSGFGYTIQSNLISDYNMQAEYDEKKLSEGMCAGPDGKVAISNICTAQRSGYDICPASEVGCKILSDAYKPLFESGLDYVQILDQNHGGGQYFCYSREHGHPPVPGAWMTEQMQKMLSDWNRRAPDMLFGCESAAAEPFIGNLAFSDNRFELCYRIGVPVPLYAYLYHEYLRNFMGNQVSCPLRSDVDTLRQRIAYSFSAGDCMTLVMHPDGSIMTNWGTRDFEHAPDKKQVFTLIANLTRFYREEAKDYLYHGRMIPACPIACEQTVTLPYKESIGGDITLPAILSTAWEADNGKRAQILINPECTDQSCTLNGKKINVPALDAVLIEI